MYQVYILLSQKDKRTYVGHTKNLKDRLLEHNSGKVIATKHRRPFTVLMIEKCQTLTEAKYRERYWKSGGGRRKLKYYFQRGFPPQGGARSDSETRRGARPK